MRHVTKHIVFFSLSLCLLVSATGTFAVAQNVSQPGQTPRPREPQVAAASDEAARAISGFQLPDGLAVKLYAAEPLIANPVAFCFDEQGRLFVAETFRQERGVEDNRNHMNWLDDEIAAETVAERLEVFRKYLGDDVMKYTLHDDRIRVLLDSDNDGVADQSTVFANGFNNIADGTGAGVLAHKGNLYYTCIPKLLLLRDDNNDNAAEVRKTLQDGYGVHVAFRGHDLHGLTLGPDGRLYFSIGDRGFNVPTPEGRVAEPHTGAVLRCNLDGTGLEIFAYGLRNPQELAFDDYGNLFTGENNSDSGDRARWVYVMQGADSGWRMSFQYFRDRGPWNQEKLWYPAFPEQASNIVPPIANFADGPSGLTYYPGTGLGDEYLETFFLCDFRGASRSSGVRTIQVEPKGAGFAISHDDRLIWRILATDIEFGPRGGAYISDWVNGWEGIGKGRIYKVENPAIAEGELVSQVDALLAAEFSRSAIADLTPLLAHADRRVRIKAQYELAAREPARAVEAFTEAASGSVAREEPASTRLALISRLHGLWGMGQVARRSESASHRADIAMQLAAFLRDDDLEVRANAARTLADCANVLGKRANVEGEACSIDLALDEVTEALVERLKDDSPRVQSLAATALGAYAGSSAIQPLLELLNRNADADPFLRHAAVMGLVGIGDADTFVSLAGETPNSLSVSQRRGLLLALRRLRDSRVRLFLRDADPSLITDAARAINDEPIDDATADLAELISQPGLPEPALRRALNASLRLRTRGHAAAVARFAGNSQATPAMRREAIAILEQWPQAPQRDRVMGLWHRQLFDAPPSRADVAEVVRPHLASMLASDKDVRDATAKLIASLRIGAAGDLLVALFTDSNQPATTRATALSALFHLEDDRARQALPTAFQDDSATVRIAALEQASEHHPQLAMRHLPAALTSQNIQERQTALTSLAQLELPDAAKLLESWAERLAGNDVEPELRLDVYLAAKSKQDTGTIAAFVETYDASRDANNPLAPFAETLHGGDAERGEEIFFNRLDLSCQRCHTIDGRGGAIGPDLSKIAEKRDRKYLLESLVAPNEKIAENYESLVIETVDGRVLSGILKEETESSVRLQTAEGNILVVAKSDIEFRDAGQSAMPNDLTDKISLRELRDLIEFLAGRK
ncbi:MAG: HEAT repeat domain-containing protein [Pirellulales bacterium]|nr:HEAT repeat domain-containing protein [Pirellulales bacterium]